MTVTYNQFVATQSHFNFPFIHMLFKWRGSIYKLVLPDLLLYLVLFNSVNLLYRFWLEPLPPDDLHRVRFIRLVRYCHNISNFIPLQFILGFYVTIIVSRWWSQFMSIPWPDTIAVLISTAIHGNDTRGRLMRRTVLRYVNLCLAMVFVMVSPQALTRFPDLEHLVDVGLLLPHERLIIENLKEKLEGPKYYVPIVWACAICAKARKEGRIPDDITLFHLNKELCKFRGMAGDILSYDWVNVPLIYTQVATLATYVYFFACILGKQLVDQTARDRMDVYVPVFHFLEFFFLMGWLKVAETMINPFGEDDDDFEVNWLIDRNLTVSYMIVDEMHEEFPELVRDQYWDEVVPEGLYYTEVALKYKKEGYAGSAVVEAEHKEKEEEGGANNLEVVVQHGAGVKSFGGGGGSGVQFGLEEQKNRRRSRRESIKEEIIKGLFEGKGEGAVYKGSDDEKPEENGEGKGARRKSRRDSFKEEMIKGLFEGKKEGAVYKEGDEGEGNKGKEKKKKEGEGEGKEKDEK